MLCEYTIMDIVVLLMITHDVDNDKSLPYLLKQLSHIEAEQYRKVI